jgi:hypothetical protein
MTHTFSNMFDHVNALGTKDDYIVAHTERSDSILVASNGLFL